MLFLQNLPIEKVVSWFNHYVSRSFSGDINVVNLLGLIN
jgi:hypothetical protein